LRILALDVGTRRIGVAISDDTGLIAQGVESYTRRSEADDLAHFKELLSDLNPQCIVLGLPKNMNGTEGPSAEMARSFGERLRTVCDIPMEYWDERLTTVMAEKILIGNDTSRKKRKKVVDKLAAVLILENYLDALRVRKEL
jgi:putative Holliday junction resolvase